MKFLLMGKWASCLGNVFITWPKQRTQLEEGVMMMSLLDERPPSIILFVNKFTFLLYIFYLIIIFYLKFFIRTTGCLNKIRGRKPKLREALSKNIIHKIC